MTNTTSTVIHSIVLQPEHGYLFIGILLLILEVFIFAILAGRVRRQVFNKKFMEENFGDLHFREVRGQAPIAGYPDMGSGRYSDKLTYYDWFRLNNAQRNHYNFIENFSILITALLIGGVFYPGPCAIIAAVAFVARILYATYLSSSGSNNKLRGIGATLTFLCLLSAVVIGFASALQILNENKHAGLYHNNGASGPANTTTTTTTTTTNTTTMFLF